METAFSALRVYARSHNLRLADVANSLLGGALAEALISTATG